uniref:NECAP PHear domain-containing protein n=1 Tax=Globisporangium ultimum (strain ATCC 200006 / CBS 805.95 / DAOM BR144) TaxID=431595 RepID=K3X1F0_GLOUD
MAEVGVQRVLTVINQCFAFKIPPQTSATGHRADSWPSEPLWTGRLVISSIDDNALIELKDANTGALFAACPIKKDGPPAVQKVVDSSRYFVLRVVDQNSGRHAFIGIAFENRSDAFDFNVAMDDFNKELQREQAAADEASKAPTVTKDYSLKQGEKITIKINSTRKTRDTTDDSSDSAFGASSSKANSSSGDVDLLGFSSTPSSASSSGWETF